MSQADSRPRIAVASDHAGFRIKRRVKEILKSLGYEPVDFGTESEESTDYPDYAHPLSRAISEGELDQGVLVCGSGIGMSISANRYKRVRAALVWNEELSELARRHNDANVLVLPGRFLDDRDTESILKRFLETPFEGGRHARRIEKIDGDL